MFFLLLLLLAGVIYVLHRMITKDASWYSDSVDELSNWIDRAWRSYLARREKQNEYTDLNVKYWTTQFLVWRNFSARTLFNFKLEYELSLMTKRVDEAEFKKHRMLENSSRQSLAEHANEEFFLPYLDEKKYFFSMRIPASIDSNRIYQAFSPLLYQLVEKDGQTYVRKYASGSFKVELFKISFKRNGCEANLGFEFPETLSDSLIEENYAMLTDEQKTAILTDENFGAIEEMLAVAALQRRLDFLGRGSKQTHECDAFSVVVEKAGRGVRIKWSFKFRHESGYELLGFRKTGGFFNDPGDEKNNGTLVIHADQNNEVIELLDEGVAYFYTLFTQWPGSEDRMVKSTVVRFQITIAPEKETMAIEAALRRITERKPAPDPANEALKELGTAVEMDTAFEAMEKSYAEQIRKSDRSEEEKERKIERLRDIVAQIRSKYEPL